MEEQWSDRLFDRALGVLADILDDFERVRTANENRLRQLTRAVEDKDGEIRGLGFKTDHNHVVRLISMVSALKCDDKVVLDLLNIKKKPPQRPGCCLEHDAERGLAQQLKEHPLGHWVKSTRGVGVKQAARLLAVIGDPYIRPALTRDGVDVPAGPRTVAALWKYSGLHVVLASQPAADGHLLRYPDQSEDDDQTLIVGVAAKRKRGERANWSPRAKSKSWLVAVSCIKSTGKSCREYNKLHVDQSASDDQVGIVDMEHDGEQSAVGAKIMTHLEDCLCSPYRVVYDKRRAHTAVTHPEWTKGHSHNDGLRIASKQILKGFWRAAREWHTGSPDDEGYDTKNSVSS